MQKYIDICFQSHSKMPFLGIEMMQCKCFFWHQTGKCLLENLWSEKSFWLCCRSILFLMSSELRFKKWVRFTEKNCIVKWMIFFASFCWLWLYARKSEIKENPGNVTGTCEQRQSCTPKIIFLKKEFQIPDFESFIFWSKFLFLGNCFWIF